MQPNPPRSTPQALGGLALTGFQPLAEQGRLQLGLGAGIGGNLRLLQPLDPLLNQHLGHVAHGAGFNLCQLSQALAEVFRQHHLDARRFGLATGGGLPGGHAWIRRGIEGAEGQPGQGGKSRKPAPTGYP